MTSALPPKADIGADVALGPAHAKRPENLEAWDMALRATGLCAQPREGEFNLFLPDKAWL